MDRQYNSQKIQTIIYKTLNLRSSNTNHTTYQRVNTDVPEVLAILVPHVEHVVILLLQTR